MAKKRLFEDVLQAPARFYRVAGDVLRDRRFNDEERVAILKAWQSRDDAREAEIAAALSELQTRVGHAAE